MIEFPELARVYVPEDVANKLQDIAVRLPVYTDEDLRYLHTQDSIRESFRNLLTKEQREIFVRANYQLHEPPYCIVIQGIDFAQQDILFVGISLLFGNLIEPYNLPGAQLVRRLKPIEDRNHDYWGILNEQLHTDGTNWPNPNDITYLLCDRPDQNGGGRSRICDVDTILEEVDSKLGKDALNMLTTYAFPWTISEQFKQDVFYQPIIHNGSIRWMRYTIQASQNKVEHPLTKDLLNLLTDFENLIENTTQQLDLQLGMNDLLIMNNKKIVHARSSIPDIEESERQFRRLKGMFHNIYIKGIVC